MPLSRLKTKGRQGGEVEQFAMIPESVYTSSAGKTLDHAAFKILGIIALYFRRPTNNYPNGRNGTAALTPEHAKEKYDLRSKDTLYRSLEALKERGLIAETRQGFRCHKNHFALYAVGWEQITHWNGQPLNTPLKQWTHMENGAFVTHTVGDYLNWQPPPGYSKRKPPKKKNHARSSGQVGTYHRAKKPISVPTIGPRNPISIPTIGNTSRDLDGDRPTVHIRERNSRAGRASKKKLLGDIRRLSSTHPHLPISDLARACHATIEQVNQALEGRDDRNRR